MRTVIIATLAFLAVFLFGFALTTCSGDGIINSPDGQAVFIAGEACVVNDTPVFGDFEANLRFCMETWSEWH